MKLKTLAKKARNVAVDTSPVGVLYAAGGGINKLTGGKTATYRLSSALDGKGRQNRFSTVTRAASGYSSAIPKAGDYGLPIVNRQTTQGLGRAAATVVEDVVAPVANEASKGLFGADLKVVAWTAAGAVVGLGALAVATRR